MSRSASEAADRRAAARIELARRALEAPASIVAWALRAYPRLSPAQRVALALLAGERLPGAGGAVIEDGPASTLSRDALVEWRGTAVERSSADIAARLLGRPWADDLLTRRPRAVLLSGRGSGKSLLAALWARYCARTCPLGDPAQPLVPGERVVIPVVAPRIEAARQVLGYVKGFERAEGNAALDGEPLTDVVRYRRGVVISLYAADQGGLSVRSKSLGGVVLDEAGFFRSASTAAVTDRDVVDAASYRLRVGAQILMVSSPWTRSAYCLELEDSEWGRSESALVLRAPAYYLNPAWVPRERTSAAAWAREVEGRMVEDEDVGIASAEIVERAWAGRDNGIAVPPRALPVDALDLAGGGPDRTAWAAAWSDPSGGVVVARVASWDRATPVEQRFEAIARERRQLGIRGPLTCDRFAFAVAEAVARRYGIELRVDTGDRATQMAAVGELLRSGRVSLPKLPALRQQFALVTIRPRDGGGLALTVPRDPDGGHCDEAVAVSLVVARAAHGDAAFFALR